MPGKGTDINIRRLFLNLDTSRDNGGTRVIASLDAEKAFDIGRVGVLVGGPEALWIWPMVSTMVENVICVP